MPDYCSHIMLLESSLNGDSSMHVVEELFVFPFYTLTVPHLPIRV